MADACSPVIKDELQHVAYNVSHGWPNGIVARNQTAELWQVFEMISSPSDSLLSLPTDHFKEICPAGHGYTYSRSDIQISLRQMEEDELHRTGPSHQPRPHHPRYHHPHPPHQPLHPTTDVHTQAKLPGREDGGK